MNTNMPAGPDVEPLTLALRSITDPYARGAFSQPVWLEPDAATPGQFKAQGYSFSVFQARFGLQESEISVTYLLTLLDDLGGSPRTIEVDYSGGTEPASLLIPDGSRPGMSFAVPIPPRAGPVFIEALRERPEPLPGQPSGGQKWAISALLGNTARLLWLLLNERQTVAAMSRDVADQHHLLTARGGSLDHLGEALGVPRLLPSPYRLDLDPHTLALFHLDDAEAPVFDATGDNHGTNVGASRGVPGKLGNGFSFGPSGGVTIPDVSAFEIGAGQSFSVEMFANLPREVPKEPLAVLAVKRPRFNSNTGTGWFLGATYVAAGSATFTFSLTDQAGTIVEATTANPVAVPEGWFHVAGVLDRPAKQVLLYINGKVAATAPAPSLGAIVNCADIGLGADRTGAGHLTGMLDEVRFSDEARSDFSAILGNSVQPYEPDAGTIALYHLDETDDWIDEDRGLHYGINHGATRGVPARFGSGLRFLGDPLPRPDSAGEREFQKLLITGAWDRGGGGALVTQGPYARFGYRQGAISLPGLSGAPQPVLINDRPEIGANVRGMVTTANVGFEPTNLDQTIQAFQAAGRSVQEAIDFFGEWQGQSETWFAQQYTAHQISATHEPCPSKPPASTYVLVPPAPDLAVGPSSDLAVEAVIKPEAQTEDYPRAIIATRSSGLRDGETSTNPEAGWALALGRFNGIPDNLRWVVGDSAGHLVSVSAGFGVADDAFHHVAGVIDRDGGQARLYVDGLEVAKEPLDSLGAVDSAGGIYLGNDPAFDAPYAGLLDEVRLSNTVRRTFEPVLGESDDRYRQRLAIYTPWRRPSFTTLLRGVRALSLPAEASSTDPTKVARLLLDDGPVSDEGQLDVVETDSRRFSATRTARVIPATLGPWQSIAADGTEPRDALTAAGSAPFYPESLLRVDDMQGLAFPLEGSRWMVLSAARALEYLAGRVVALASGAVINVVSAWDPSAGGLAAQGRLLTLTVASPDPRLDLGILGALAHQAGVAYVGRSYNFATSSWNVTVAVAAGPELDLTGPALAPLGLAVSLSVARPILPNPALCEWELVACGPGDGLLTPGGATATFTGRVAGPVIVQVRYPVAGGQYLRGAIRLTVAPQTLDGCEVLGGDGTENVEEFQVSGPPDSDFQEAYLVRSADPRIDYASDPARRMQLPLETQLIRLAELATAEPGAPRVSVLAAYDPSAPSLQSVGRGLVVAPSSPGLTAARLGALAFLAGFSYIERRRYPPSVYVSVPQGDRFAITNGPIERLGPNARISGQGVPSASETEAAGPPDPNFTAAMLQPYTNARVSFASGISNQMQKGLASALNALLSALKHAGASGPLQIVSGYDPKATTLAAEGRSLRVRHPSVATDRLAGLAYQTGFGFVSHEPNAENGPAAYVAAYPDTGPPLNVAGPDDLLLNALALVSIRPSFTTPGQLDWGLSGAGAGAAVLGSAPPEPGSAASSLRKILRGTSAGPIRLTAAFSLRDAAEPYQFLVQARPAPDGTAEPRITKDQYDDLMNYLDAFLPVGVEAVARGIRRYVHGFHRPARWDRLPASQTYPRYRTNR